VILRRKEQKENRKKREKNTIRDNTKKRSREDEWKEKLKGRKGINQKASEILVV
jgi:hypothetical protein